MKSIKRNQQLTRRIALVGLLTAAVTVFSYIRIPLVSTATVTLVLPLVVIGAVLCGPIVGAWLTVIPAIISFSEASLFMAYSLGGTVATLILKGILAGFAAGMVYKLLARKRQKMAVALAAAVAPIVNSGVFLLGCYIFLWPELVELAAENSVGIGMLLFGLVGMNFIVELILNLALTPAVFRIVKLGEKKKLW